MVSSYSIGQHRIEYFHLHRKFYWTTLLWMLAVPLDLSEVRVLKLTFLTHSLSDSCTASIKERSCENAL